MPTLIVRAHSSVNDGMGHVVRSMAVAQRWKQLGIEYDVVFVHSKEADCFSRELPVREELQPNWAIYSAAGVAGGLTDAEFFMHTDFGKDSVVLVDGYVFTAEYLRYVADRFPVVFVSEQCPFGREHNTACIAVVDPEYRGSGCLFPYAALRSEFDLWQQHDRHVHYVRDVLLMIGGSDPLGVTLPLFDGILRQAPPWRTHVVYGGDDAEAITVMKHMCHVLPERFNWRGRLDAKELSDLMALCDLAITGGGSTLMELAWMKVPAVAVCVSPNQMPLVRDLNQKTVDAVSWLDQGSATGVIHMACELADDEQKRKRYIAAGRSVVDGRGGERIIGILLNQLESGGA